MALGKLTLIGLNNYLDGTLFNGIRLPEEIDSELFINTFLLRYGECPVLYMNPDYVKLHIKSWADKTYANWDRMIKALLKKYDPLRNYDRYEEEEEKTENDVQNSGADAMTVQYNRTTTDTRTDNLTQENKVSAFNESTYSPDTKIENGGSRTDNIVDANNGTSTTNFGRKVDEDTDRKRNAHIYGNIGVTTAQQMLREELEIATFNIYDVMATSLASEVCILIY